jgi:hypothetical protein
MRRLPNIFESIEYAPGPRRKSAIITKTWIENSKDLSGSHAGQHDASRVMENRVATGVNAPQKRKKLVRAKATILHGLTPFDEL